MKILFVVVKHGCSIGASEDLVFAAASRMAESGDPPAFWFNFPPSQDDKRIQQLIAAGCRIYFWDSSTRFVRIRKRFLHDSFRRARENSLRKALQCENPTRVILNQGGNSDASLEAPVLRKAGVPYIVISHSATASTWPEPDFLLSMRSIYEQADCSFFVSREIRELTEAQLGIVLDRALVIYNPCKYTSIQSCRWPDLESHSLSLAAIARLENKTKGHDLILRVLALPCWRNRPLQITFYGAGPHRDTLESYAEVLRLESVTFAGQVHDISATWERHHGFIQASRYEGYGLSLLEAMFCQRMAITTPIPAAKEFVTEGETGFLARAASVEELSDALERAWTKRDHWREMGLAASRRVDDGYPKDPVGDFLILIN